MDDGTDVRVSWLDEWSGFALSGELYRDFGILDEHEVVAHIYGARNIPIKVRIIKNVEQIKEYKDIFSKMHKLSHSLSEVLARYPMRES